ncbi:hypothetical protein HYU95_04085 [Candidatus Daviesbacteria bacterium]|nr:hypothetical protein [Candidatus Daviesbacteria bacterium]
MGVISIMLLPEIADMPIALECREKGSGTANIAGIVAGDYFTSAHPLNEAKISQTLALSDRELSFSGDPAFDASLNNIVVAWLTIGAASAVYAGLPESKGEMGTVVFGKLDISFVRNKPHGGNMNLNTLASKLDGSQGSFSTHASVSEKPLSSALANLVFDPFPFTGEDMDKLKQQAAKAKEARSAQPAPALEPPKPPVLVFPRIFYKATKTRGAQTAAITEDFQALHNPDMRVEANKKGLVYDENGNIKLYEGNPRSEYDIPYGDLTRFRSPITHGVLTLWAVLAAFARVKELVPADTVTVIDRGTIRFTGPVRYGFTGKLKMAVACSTEAGSCLGAEFILGLVPLEKLAA